MVETKKDCEPTPIPSLTEVVEATYNKFLTNEFGVSPNGFKYAYTEYHASEAVVDELIKTGINPIDLVAVLAKQATTIPEEIPGFSDFSTVAVFFSWDKFFSLVAQDIVRGELVKAHPEIEETANQREKRRATNSLKYFLP